ncbi:MAG: TonB-dependent receptor [bacterium]
MRAHTKSFTTVVVASQRTEYALDTARSVDVLDKRKLLQLASRSTPELLENLSGVVVQKTNHGGGSPFIRGFTGQHILYLIDGIRLNNSTTRYGPNQALNTIDPFLLTRMELLRGPGSLLYGSDAIGGVIYLFSRRAPYHPGAGFRWGGEVTALFGSADMSQAYNLGAWTQYRRLTVYAGGSFKDFNNLVGGRGIGEQPWTGYQEGSYDGAVTLHMSSGWSLKVATHGTRQLDVPRTDQCTATDFRYYRHQFRDLVYAKLSGHKGKLLDRLDVVLSYQRHLEDRDRFRLDRDRIDFENDRVHTVGFSVIAGTDLGRYSALVYGLDVYYDWVSSSGRRESISTGETLGSGAASARGRFVDGSQYLAGGVFLADTLKPWKWLHLRVGGRFAFSLASLPGDPLADVFDITPEPISDSSFGFGGGLSLTFIPWKPLRLITSVQHSFRAPNLDDYSHVGSEGSGFDVPSPDLSPEEATTFEAGIKWAGRWVTARVFGHYSLLRNFISRVYTGYEIEGQPATRRANAARGYLAGVEGGFKVRFPRGFYLSSWISWTQGDLTSPLDDSIMQPLQRASPLQGLAAVGYQSPRFWAQVRLRWSDRQDRLSLGDLNDARICPTGPDGCRGTPGFAVLSLAGGVRLGRHVDVTLRFENVTNEPYKYHGSGVYAPGLSGIALLRVRR